jgi:hypothetical protein
MKFIPDQFLKLLENIHQKLRYCWEDRVNHPLSDAFASRWRNLNEVPQVAKPTIIRVPVCQAEINKVLLLPKGYKVAVVADLHGSNVQKILDLTEAERRLQNGEKFLLLFLGDVGDKGDYSVECWDKILHLVDAYPQNVFVLKGNHETEELAGDESPYSLYSALIKKFPTQENLFFRFSLNVFENLPLAAIDAAAGTILCHAGLPFADDVVFLGDLFRNDDNIFWSDFAPDFEGDHAIFNFGRGAGSIFGPRQNRQLAERFNFLHQICGHKHSFYEWQETLPNAKKISQTMFSSISTPVDKTVDDHENVYLPRIMLYTTGSEEGRCIVRLNDPEAYKKAKEFFCPVSAAAAGAGMDYAEECIGLASLGL